MSYYQRPMGDYKTYGYAGDPGFLSSLWRGIKTVGKSLLGIPPVPQVGPAIAAGAAGYGVGSWMPGAGFTGGGGARGPSMPGFQYPSTGPMSAAPGQPGLLPPVGYHLAKDGSGRFVRNRRMNIANPRALRRAMRRVQGFEKLAKRTVRFTRRVKMKTKSSS